MVTASIDVPLRIVVIAPPWFEVPPRGYGGIEVFCHSLVEGLVERGHEVTLVAAGSNHTSADFIRTYEDPPERRVGEAMPELVHGATAARVVEQLDIDVVHCHTLGGALAAAGQKRPLLLTTHWPVEGDFRHYYRALGHTVSLVAISEAQRRLDPELPWIGTVHNAITVNDYPFREKKEDFVLFLGRMGSEKGADLAIDAARRVGLPLVMAGKCQSATEKRYFEREIRPRMGPDITWLGHADRETKKELFAKARCLIFPVQWEEPFGMVLLEALACGTPIVALRRGSVPEIVTDEETGFVCGEAFDLPDGLKRVEELDPHACRARAREFNVERMVGAYETIYGRLIRSRPLVRTHPRPSRVA